MMKLVDGERLRSIPFSIDDLVIVLDGDGLLEECHLPRDVAAAMPLPRGWESLPAGAVFPGRVAAEIEKAFAAVKAEGRERRFELSLPAGDGELSFDGRAIPRGNGGGAFAGISVVARDVTPWRRAEAQLAAARREAEEAKRTRSELLAGMSHELRTPLTAIIGYSEILMLDYFGSLNDRQRQQVETILQCSHHLLQLINDVLDIARIESGGAQLEMKSVAIAALLRHSLTSIRESAARRRIRATVLVPLELEAVKLLADERRIAQVVAALLSNAVKYTPDGGRIEASLRREEADRIAIVVTDTGVGIAAGELERIFDPFSQGGSGSPGAQSGSGVGLALSRKIAELHGGRLWAESGGEGMGSSFTLVLPLHSESRLAPA